MNCRQVRRLLALHVGRDLPPEEAARVEDHLRGCEACERERERYDRSRRVLFRLRGEARGPAPDLWPAIRERLPAPPSPSRRLPLRAAAALALAGALGLGAILALSSPGGAGASRPRAPAPAVRADPPPPPAEPEFLLAEMKVPPGYRPLPRIRLADPRRGTRDDF